MQCPDRESSPLDRADTRSLPDRVDCYQSLPAVDFPESFLTAETGPFADRERIPAARCRPWRISDMTPDKRYVKLSFYLAHDGNCIRSHLRRSDRRWTSAR